MKYNQIPNTNLKVSAMCLGTWVWGGDCWGGAKEEDCLSAMEEAFASGINFIDTAPIYGSGVSESIVGKGIKGKREKVVLATKCGLSAKGTTIFNDLSPKGIEKEIDVSLKRLNTDYIDLYQCHWPDPKVPIEKTIEALLKIKSQGKIKYIGVSNFDPALLKKASQLTTIVTLQSQLSLLDRNLEKDVLPFCHEKSIGFLAYGPLAGGILSGKYQKQTDFAQNDARSFFYKFYSGQGFQKYKRLNEELKKINKPINQIAINWVRQQKGVVSALVGCRTAQHVRENVAALNWDLTQAELETLNNLELEKVQSSDRLLNFKKERGLYGII